MILPKYVRTCVDLLERAGFATYAVGGCVRDSLLGLTPHDYDLCTAATPAQTQSIFHDYRLVLAGEKHGTVCVITEGGPVEITTFRTEGGYQDSRHPDWVRFVTTIEEDLSRRDFTVNAMAFSPTRGLIDPFGGQTDLKAQVLRAVGNPTVRFTEDALRILRGVRFAVRFGLEPEPNTDKAMTELAQTINGIAKERVFEELCKLLPLVSAGDLLRFQPVLTAVIPELATTVGFDQHSPHHAYDVFTHTAYVVEGVPPVLPLRLAALLHDIGKPEVFYTDEDGRGHFPNHAKVSADLADAILLRLKSPTVLRQQAVTLIARHMTALEPDKKRLRRWLGRFGQETVEQLLQLQEADMSAKGKGRPPELAQFPALRELIRQLLTEEHCFTIRDLAVSGNDLLAIGFLPGKALGTCLNALLEQVLDERLPNSKEALTAAARRLLKEQEA